MYSLVEGVVPRASTARCFGSASKAFTPVHHASHALAPGLIHEMSLRRLGVASVATKSDPARSAAVRPKIKTRHGLTRGTVDTTNPFPSERRSNCGLTVGEPVPTSDMPAQSNTSDSAMAQYPAGVF